MGTAPEAKSGRGTPPNLRGMRQQLDALDDLLEKMLHLPLPVVAERRDVVAAPGLRLAAPGDDVAEAGVDTPEAENTGAGEPADVLRLPTTPEVAMQNKLAAAESLLARAVDLGRGGESAGPPMPEPRLYPTMTMPGPTPAVLQVSQPTGTPVDETGPGDWRRLVLGWVGILLLLGAAGLALGRWLAQP
ncbi:MAG TPA: hypothetical protein PKD86_06290 [Gemmatales bacterium]|nr:hypothetical protein [Gemmatales bacterium]